ncbi:MAG: teichoic acid D-Ala incorporation-associated protein DltX [Streptococcaceae bacterium]|jgi:hypothetical protein|nr:teichoic acid D-Ala incorporation-associated protein DltX [Streptococcaceae bacterium]
MLKKLENWFSEKPALVFILKTFFYFAVIVVLIYLYSYSRTGGSHFIYNEF